MGDPLKLKVTPIEPLLALNVSGPTLVSEKVLTWLPLVHTASATPCAVGNEGEIFDSKQACPPRLVRLPVEFSTLKPEALNEGKKVPRFPVISTQNLVPRTRRPVALPPLKNTSTVPESKHAGWDPCTAGQPRMSVFIPSVIVCVPLKLTPVNWASVN